MIVQNITKCVLSSGKLARAGFNASLTLEGPHLERGGEKVPLYLRGNSYYLRVRLPTLERYEEEKAGRCERIEEENDEAILSLQTAAEGIDQLLLQSSARGETAAVPTCSPIVEETQSLETQSLETEETFETKSLETKSLEAYRMGSNGPK